MTAPEQTAKRAKRTPKPSDPRLAQAADVLERHNAWRRDGGGEMTCVKELGQAIDLAVNVLRGHPLEARP